MVAPAAAAELNHLHRFTVPPERERQDKETTAARQTSQTVAAAAAAQVRWVARITEELELLLQSLVCQLHTLVVAVAHKELEVRGAVEQVARGRLRVLRTLAAVVVAVGSSKTAAQAAPASSSSPTPILSPTSPASAAA
jgi:hypothetical protein